MSETMKLVEELNGKVYDDQYHLDMFSLHSNGYCDTIRWNGIELYSTDTSDLGWNEEKDEPERTVAEEVLMVLKVLQFELSEVIRKLEK